MAYKTSVKLYKLSRGKAAKILMFRLWHVPITFQRNSFPRWQLCFAGCVSAQRTDSTCGKPGVVRQRRACPARWAATRPCTRAGRPEAQGSLALDRRRGWVSFPSSIVAMRLQCQLKLKRESSFCHFSNKLIPFPNVNLNLVDNHVRAPHLHLL